MPETFRKGIQRSVAIFAAVPRQMSGRGRFRGHYRVRLMGNRSAPGAAVAFQPTGDELPGGEIADADAFERPGRSRAVGVELGHTRNRSDPTANVGGTRRQALHGRWRDGTKRRKRKAAKRTVLSLLDSRENGRIYAQSLEKML